MTVPFTDLQIVTAPQLNAAFASVAQASDVAAAVAVEAGVRAGAMTAEALARLAGDTAAGNALTAAIAGLLPLNVRKLGCAGDGVTDDTAALQAVINLAENAGGGVVFLPVGTYKISQTLTIKRSGVRLIGAGLDCSHDYTPSWPTNANTAPVTSLLWAGANGGTMVRVAPVGNADNGAGLGGNAVLDIVCQGGVFPFSTAAAFGVVVAAAKAGEYRLFGLECSIAALSFQTLNRNPAWNNSTWFNQVYYLGSRNVSTAGGALRLDGVTNCGNSYDNVFHIIDALHTNGHAVDLYSCDNNVFHLVRIQRIPGGAGVGVFFHAAVPIDMSARANLFHLLSPGAGGVYSEYGTTPAYENKIYNYNPDENGAPATPVIGTGSTLYWTTTKKSGACNFHAAMPGSQSIPSGVFTVVNFAAVLADEAFWYDTGNKRWRPRYPGTYQFTACLPLTVSIASGSVTLAIFKNGGASTNLAVVRTTRATGQDSITVSGQIYLNGTTDYVDCELYQDSGAAGTIVATAQAAYFQGARVG